MHRPLVPFLLMAVGSSCWVGHDFCYSTLLDCESGQTCIEGRCMESAPKSLSCTPDGDPIASPDGAASRSFGTAVALAGNVLIVGDPDALGAMTPDGGAYVFELDKLERGGTALHNSAKQGTRFGATVVIRGDKFWVGAPAETATSGAVYQHSLAALGAGTSLMDGGIGTGSNFGAALAADSVVLVGLPGGNSIWAFPTDVLTPLTQPMWKLDDPETNGNKFGDKVGTAGQGGAVADGNGNVWVFRIQASLPTLSQLSPPAGRRFTSIALSNEYLLVHTESTSGGDGALSVYQGSVSDWQLSEPRLIPTAASATSLAIDGQLAALGAVEGKGRAWAALRVANAWRIAEIASPTGSPWDATAEPKYGSAIAVSGDRVAVGAPGLSGGRVYLYRCLLR